MSCCKTVSMVPHAMNLIDHTVALPKYVHRVLQLVVV